MPAVGYEFGYAVGAICADGTVAKRCISLVVNDEEYAKRFAVAMGELFGVTAQLEAVERPSGYLKRPVAGYAFGSCPRISPTSFGSTSRWGCASPAAAVP